MFSPLGRSTTSCCMRSLRAPILSSTLSFSSTAPVASPLPSFCSFTNSAIPVSCQPNHYSQVISRKNPLKVGATQSMLVRKLSSADEGKREESEAEKKRSAQLSQVHRFLHSVTFYYLSVFSQVVRPALSGGWAVEIRPESSSDCQDRLCQWPRLSRRNHPWG